MTMTRSSYSIPAVTLLLLLALAVPGVVASTSAQPGYIVVGIAPSAQFDASYAFSTIPTKVTFVDTSLGSAPLSYQWDFGDGATSAEQNPSHNYIQRGTYTVSLTVRNAYGSSTAIKKDFISIGMSPRADFSANPTTGSLPLAVKFTDQSQGQVTKWTWDFGDGQRSSEQSPVHTYWTSGVYNVILTVSNDYGSADTTKTRYISVIGALTSKFTADPSSGSAPLTVAFTDRSMGNPTAWKWDFGDGTNASIENPVHIFTNPGSYDVSLTVTRDGDTDTSKQVVNAGGVPNADFSGTPLSINVGESVRFTDKTTNAPTGWSWDFGDTATSSDQNPSHTYMAKGIYTVSLTAKNLNGRDTEVKQSYVNVGVAPKAEFIPVIIPYQKTQVPMQVAFIDQSAGNPTSWQWDFGDGQTSGEQNPKHLYQKEGVYTVKLTAKNNFGEDTRVRTNLITVAKGPAVDFSADRTTIGVGGRITFTDLSANSPTNWVWDFGDGSTGTGPKPDHIYRSTGVYDVTLIASNPEQSNSLTRNQYITVLNIPRAEFVADKTRGSAPLDVHFIDQSMGSPTSWKWDFGDGETTIEKNPVHTYTSLGTFTVTLTVSNVNGQDTATKTAFIETTLAPVAEFKADRQVGKAPFIVQFADVSKGNPTAWTWEFGDGTGSSDQNPRHIYLNEGAYNVRLTVTNQYGSDSVFKTGAPVQATQAPVQTTAPVTTQAPAVVPTTADNGPATTQAPLSPFVTLLASVMGFVAIAIASRK
jgi:PKD repeat protein